MGLVINHNMMAMRAARNLSKVYSALNKSMTRLSSGLRVNSAADDAAGLAIRELMRADIMVLGQGLRNASDGISMIQTAEGALSVVDEKLIRMKELAEQAATGTYTTVQRDLMNSEYQAMAAEIDRIANATDFNGVNMLNGDMAIINDGSGMKIHFGTGNNPTQDYYFVTIGDVRATSRTGLQIGGGATADVWTNNTSYDSLSSTIGAAAGDYASFWYNVSANSAIGNSWASAMATAPEHLVGIYETGASTTLQGLIDTINQGTAARIQLDFSSSAMATVAASAAALAHLYVGNTDVVLVYESAAATSGGAVAYDIMFDTATNSGTNVASGLTAAFNAYTSADTFAVLKDADSIVFFSKQAGVTGNTIAFNEAGLDISTTWLNLANNSAIADAGNFSMGGLTWINADSERDAAGNYALSVTGNERGADYDVWALDVDDVLSNATTWSNPLTNYSSAASDWSQAEGSGTGGWDGADILTQSAAQLALDALGTAIERKDNVRSSLGAFQNRLENTITVISIQAENLQAAESRISDVDVAWEMMEFTKNQIMVQAATAMLAQANAISQIALSLLQ
ncbi:MAG: flagellin [Deltaproteobacteria bacterium]|nr:flagellin [Deltaproteobacteria bacterium]